MSACFLIRDECGLFASRIAAGYPFLGTRIMLLATLAAIFSACASSSGVTRSTVWRSKWRITAGSQTCNYSQMHMGTLTLA